MSREALQTSRDSDILLAVKFVGGLWGAIRSVDGPRPNDQKHHHIKGVFDPEWLQSLTLPIGKNRPEQQTVALGRNMRFERHSDEVSLKEAYGQEHRTKIYEAVESRTGGWSAEATRYLMRLAGCDVVCSVYESSVGDKTLGPHRDIWYGAVVQMLGAKAWQLGGDVEEKKPTLVAEAGDVLIVPEDVYHDVSTPDHSVHMTVAMLTSGYEWMKPEVEAGRIVPSKENVGQYPVPW